PVVASIHNRAIQVYNDLQLVPYFALPEGVPDHESAIIVPFTIPSQQNGALVFFVGQRMPVENNDIFVYEQFVSQLDSVLLRAHQNQLQGRQLALNRHLVGAWGIFANVHSFDEAVRLLCAALSDIRAVRNVLIAYHNPQSATDTLIDDTNG